MILEVGNVIRGQTAGRIEVWGGRKREGEQDLSNTYRGESGAIYKVKFILSSTIN